MLMIVSHSVCATGSVHDSAGAKMKAPQLSPDGNRAALDAGDRTPGFAARVKGPPQLHPRLCQHPVPAAAPLDKEAANFGPLAVVFGQAAGAAPSDLLR
mmetsp:Transcript_3630/g.6005  ORF Transcript_3630/g.6005 Transcript_3630/m.6005 type:complete len:99 (+) Transcript_3630:214-510(+)